MLTRLLKADQKIETPAGGEQRGQEGTAGTMQGGQAVGPGGAQGGLGGVAVVRFVGRRPLPDKEAWECEGKPLPLAILTIDESSCVRSMQVKVGQDIIVYTYHQVSRPEPELVPE
jgi:hypothetical protein